MWMLVVIMVAADGSTAFVEFPVFDTLAECKAVTAPWMNVPTQFGRIAGAACEPARGLQT